MRVLSSLAEWNSSGMEVHLNGTLAEKTSKKIRKKAKKIRKKPQKKIRKKFEKIRKNPKKIPKHSLS